MRVNLSRYDRAVSQQLLYVSDIHILFEKQGGEGMAEHMGGDMLCDSGCLTVLVDHESNRLVRQLLPKTIYEEPSGSGDFF